LQESQKNMFWFTIMLVIVNLFFLLLGSLLYYYAAEKNIALPARTDDLYPMLAVNHFSLWLGIIFILGIVAAAYSSADSALTALTTSFCVDFLGFEKDLQRNRKGLRMMVHLGFCAITFLVIIVFRAINDDSVITSVFKAAGYTYGPLLGLFSFGLFTKRALIDKWVPLVCLLSPVISYLININSAQLLFGYKFGFEILMLNGVLTFLGLLIISKK
jgi:Na+/proline symporter